MLLRRIRNRLFPKPRAPANRFTLMYADPAVARPVNYPRAPERTVMPLLPHRVAIEAAANDDPPRLDREGFARFAHRSSAASLLRASEVGQTYYAELERLIRDITGAKQACALPHPVVRSNAPVDTDLTVEGTAGVIHVDYTAASVDEAASAALRHAGLAERPPGRMHAYTVWRSLTPPPQDHPLALCDLRTLASADLVIGDAYGASGSPEDHAEFCLLSHGGDQVWSYFPELHRDEVVVFKQYDSAMDGPSGVPHSAFDLSARAPAATPRISLEVRVFAFD